METVPAVFIGAICEDRDGKLWLGTNQPFLFALDPQTGQTFRHDIFTRFPKPTEGRITAIAEAPDGSLILGTNQGFLRFSPQSGTLTPLAVPLSQPAVSAAVNLIDPGFADCPQLFRDRHQQIWGATKSGLVRIDPATNGVTVFRNHPLLSTTLSNDNVRAVFEDRVGTLWVGTLGGGLCAANLEAQGFRSFKRDPLAANTLPNNLIIGMLVDRSGRAWIGCREGGVVWLDPTDGTMLPPPTGFTWPADRQHLTAKTFYEDHQGDIWIGTSGGGLFRFQPGTRRLTNFKNAPGLPPTIPNNHVSCLTEDETGTIWIGTRGGGICSLDPQRVLFTTFTHQDNDPSSLVHGSVRSLAVGRDGILWVGTSYGLSRFDRRTKQAVNFTAAPNRPGGLSHNDIWALCESRDGTLWVGTSGGGLNHYDPRSQTFQVLTERAGLANNTVNSVLADDQGRIWASTNRGLSCVTPGPRPEIRNFAATDGLQSDEFNQGAGCRTAAGELVFGGIEGLTVVTPSRIRTNPNPPPVVLTGFRKFNQPVRFNQPLSDTPEILIRHTDNFIAFEFVALNFVNSRQNQYAYKLEGFDPDWIQVGAKREATYTNLDGGHYTFRVKACNNDGLWNEAGAAIRLRVLPPWWRTPLAYTLFALGAVGIGYGSVRLRVRALEERNRKLESKVTERTRELKDYVAQLQDAKQETERKNAELDAKNLQLDQNLLELREKNQALIESQQQADRIFSALAETLPGTILEGKYRLDEKIGAGGFGAVFRGTHLRLDRPIAVKIFRPSPGNDSADAVERFRREGVSASRLQHPNAVQVLDSGISEDGIAYLVMELLQGESLADELRRTRRMRLRRAVEIVTPVCSVLAEAHRLGIVHRDIKPENIFLHHSGEGEIVKVVDFGIAKLVAETAVSSPKLTATGGIIGTPLYMSPECLSNQPFDGRADVYSLAVTVYEMLCGATPFEGKASGFVEIVMAHLKDVPPALKERNPLIPDAVDAVVLQGLAKFQERRPTAAVFSAAFAAAAEPWLDAESHFDPSWSSRETVVDAPTTAGNIAEMPTIATDPPAFGTPAQVTDMRTVTRPGIRTNPITDEETALKFPPT
ncbi:MAG: protein kinase [Blastocatellia bacterium]|nr:protein kinase [Blastocatellia bacterium]